MPRNAEVIRQWTILREVERSRTVGLTIDALASLTGVTTRTIRRDLQALEEAGFPLYDDRSQDDGRTRWKINGEAFKGLAAGLTVSEICALYFSRTLLESLSGTPFREVVESAFAKLASVMTPHMRQFLDQLPRFIATKPEGARRRVGQEATPQEPIVARALEATLQSRQATVTYFSKSSGRTKTYLLHPHRLAYAEGGLYLQAFVPEYNEIRTFAIERIQDISLLEEHFTPIEDLPAGAFPDSLGVHSGPPTRVEIEFRSEVADYVREREWHPSQEIQELASGALTVTLNVCLDRALRSWILSFGPQARVVGPQELANEIAELIEEARSRYGAQREAKRA
ncbi:MAG TPA: WYL domain-containing protein [Vicinamibacterales bacterium]|nr:WYL domain-containing protein [Vicinamibacterales bacterium]